jgi:zinc/manganese transport system ATP-binding protein
MDRSPALRLHDLTLGYERRPAVHHIAGDIARGSLLAVVGPNGAGKSTLLKGIAGALPPLQGTIDRGALTASDFAYLPQAGAIDRSFPASVYDVVAMGLWRSRGMFGGIGRRDRTRVEEAIAAVGLTGFEARSIGSLSGGQMQRALFARLLLQDARVILLDEPFTAIDARTTGDLLGLIARWQGEARTTIAVLHDHEIVRSHFPECLVLAREVVAWGTTADVLTPAVLLQARRMVEAWDAEAGVCAA